MSLQHERVALCRYSMRGSRYVVTTGEGRVVSLQHERVVCVSLQQERVVCVVTA